MNVTGRIPSERWKRGLDNNIKMDLTQECFGNRNWNEVTEYWGL